MPFPESKNTIKSGTPIFDALSMMNLMGAMAFIAGAMMFILPMPETMFRYIGIVAFVVGGVLLGLVHWIKSTDSKVPIVIAAIFSALVGIFSLYRASWGSFAVSLLLSYRLYEMIRERTNTAIPPDRENILDDDL